MPAPHYSVFYRPDAFPAAQPTVSKHWRQVLYSALKLFLETFTVNRFRLRSWLADKHLQSAMKVECSQFSPNIEQMAIKDKCNISHQLLVTAVVFQDMTLVVWNTFPDCFFTSQRCYLCFCFLLFYIFVPVSSHKPLGGRSHSSPSHFPPSGLSSYWISWVCPLPYRCCVPLTCLIALFASFLALPSTGITAFLRFDA